MASPREGEVFRNDFFFGEGFVKLFAVASGNDVIIDGVSEVGGRSSFGDVEFVGIELNELVAGLGTEEISARSFVSAFAHGDDGIDENGEIWTATLPLDWVCGFSFTQIVFGDGHGGEMAASRKPDDANSIYLEIPVCCSHAGHPERTFDIEKRAKRVSFWQTIIEHYSSDAVGVEPLSNGSTFGFNNLSVTSAGRNDECGAIWPLRVKDCESGIGLLEVIIANWSFSLRPQFDRFMRLLSEEIRSQDEDDGECVTGKSDH